MAKKMPSLAVAIFSMAMLSSNANAGWLDIIKGIASGVIGTQQSQNLQQSAPAANNAPAVPKATAQAVQPTEEDVLAAINQLIMVCGQGLPCGVGQGRGVTISAAMRTADSRAITALAKSLGTSVEMTAGDELTTGSGGDSETGAIDESTEAYAESVKLAVNQSVKGSQTYASYSRKDGKVFEFTIVKVLNPALFEKAMEAKAYNDPNANQIIKESIRSVIDLAKKNSQKKR